MFRRYDVLHIIFHEYKLTAHKNGSFFQAYPLYDFIRLSNKQFDQRWLEDIAAVKFAGVQPADCNRHAERQAGGGGAPVFSHSPHIHLAVPIIQGSVHTRSLPASHPASPSCEKWVMEFKGTCSLVILHSRLSWLFLPTHGCSSSVCVCLRSVASCSEIHKAVSESVSLSQKTFITLYVCISLGLCGKLPCILPHDLPFVRQMLQLWCAVTCSLATQWPCNLKFYFSCYFFKGQSSVK